MTAASEVDLRLIRIASLLESNPAAAAREAAQIVRSHPQHAAALLLLGTAHRACGDAQAALAEFSELAAAQPDSAPVQLELGRTLAAEGDAEQALGALSTAVQLQPDLAEAHAAAGEAEDFQGALSHVHGPAVGGGHRRAADQVLGRGDGIDGHGRASRGRGAGRQA